MQSVKVTKSVGVVFIDCDKCNANCALQQEIAKHTSIVRFNAPFSDLKQYTIRSRCVTMSQITENTQKMYDLACKTCYNCTEKQR